VGFLATVLFCAKTLDHFVMTKYNGCNSSIRHDEMRKEKMMFTPSAYQQAVFDWVREGSGHAFVDAAAGSGKSTTLVQAAALLPKRTKALFCAYNRHIAVELDEKLKKTGSTMECRTIHSLGRGALANALKRMRSNAEMGDPEPRKYSDLCDYYIYHLSGLSSVKYDFFKLTSCLKTFVDLCRSTLTEASDQGLKYLIEHYDLEFELDEVELSALCKGVNQVIEQGAEQFKKLAKIDYTDMIFLPVYLKLAPKKYSFIFIDEAQDLSACQLEVVMMACKQDTRLLFCGDARQAIYGFTGADTESVQKIIERCQATVLPLSICYRCPASHIALAQQVFSGIEPSPSAEDGIIQVVDGELVDTMAKAGDYIICRTNAPLVSRCQALIRQGVQATVLGRDLGKSFVDLLKKLEKTENFAFEWLIECATAYQQEQERILSKYEDNELQVAYLHDKIATLKALHQAYLSEVGVRAGNLKGFKEYIEHFFKPEEDENGKRIDYSSFVVLCSIHKAKGMEAKRIFVDRPDLLPHPAAKAGWQLEQEYNILYVALTRAKADLYFIKAVPSPIQLPEDLKEVVASLPERSLALIAATVGHEQPIESSVTLPVEATVVEMEPVAVGELAEGRVSRVTAIEVLCPSCNNPCVDPATGSPMITYELVGHTVVCSVCQKACIVPFNAFSQPGDVVAREKPTQAAPHHLAEKKGRTKKERKAPWGVKPKSGKAGDVRQPLQLSLNMRTIRVLNVMGVNKSALFEELLEMYDPFLEALASLPVEDEAVATTESEETGEPEELEVE
jgi:DNA helicase-2/ATP-dependent DNA helicase PcrA